MDTGRLDAILLFRNPFSPDTPPELAGIIRDVADFNPHTQNGHLGEFDHEDPREAARALQRMLQRVGYKGAPPLVGPSAKVRPDNVGPITTWCPTAPDQGLYNKAAAAGIWDVDSLAEHQAAEADRKAAEIVEAALRVAEKQHRERMFAATLEPGGSIQFI